MHDNKKNDHQSRFLEATLLRQAEGELKNLIIRICRLGCVLLMKDYWENICVQNELN